MGGVAADIFEDVTLTWDGVDYVIPANKCLRLAYKVEMALRQDSGLNAFELLHNPPMTSLAFAYGAALRFAGVVVTDEAVHAVLVRDFVKIGRAHV